MMRKMTITRSPISISVTAMAIVVLFFLALSAGTSTADARQAEQKKGKVMKKTESGLQYVDEEEGTGESPEPGQKCVVHYTGCSGRKNAKGKEFDSSKSRGEPFMFPVGMKKVIAGWDEGVSTMKVGGKRELLIPPDLAYGERGAGGVIPPNATLLFEVELLGVMTRTKSGLEYRDIKVGTGPSPRRGQTCVMHYTGWLWRNAKGKKFDSSVDRREPFSFAIGQKEVIGGWDEGVATMKVGGKRELLIPPDLGYGQRGAGRDIPPNATLLFEVELLDVK